MHNPICDQAEQWISMRLDGEALGGAEDVSLDGHLAVCGACRENLEVQKARSALLRASLGGTLGSAPGNSLGGTLDGTLDGSVDGFRGQRWGAAGRSVDLAAAILREIGREPAGGAVVPGRRPGFFPLKAAAAAAALLCGVSAGLFFAGRSPPGGSPPDGLPPESGEGGVPVSGAGLAVDSEVQPDFSVTFVIEETVDGAQVMPGDDGNPIRQEVERERRFTFPVPGSGQERVGERVGEGAGKRNQGGGVGWERVKTRNIRLVNWPYR